VGGGGPYVGGGSSIGSQPNAQGQPSPYPGQPAYPGQYPTQYPGAPGAPVNPQAGNMSPYNPTTQGANSSSSSFAQQGLNGDQQNAAAKMIQGLLTQGRPGGASTSPGGAGTVMGGGIAGVASTADADSIMVYNDHSNYGEWEFVYDPMKDRQLFNPVTGTVAMQPAGMTGLQQGPTGNQPGPTGSQPGPTGSQPSPTGFGPTGMQSGQFGMPSGQMGGQPITSFGQGAGRR
jgi:hypothetical protein